MGRPRRHAGRVVETPDPEPQYLYLTTTGRRTGRAREIEIWFTALDTQAQRVHATRLYVVAEHGDRAGWVQNLCADSTVTVRVGTQKFAGRARVVAATERPLYDEVRTRMIAKYGWGDGLVVEITPDG